MKNFVFLLYFLSCLIDVSSCCSESQREAALLLGQFAATDSDCKVESCSCICTYIYIAFFIILFIFARALDFSHMLVCCKQDGGNNKKKLNFLLFGVGLFVQ